MSEPAAARPLSILLVEDDDYVRESIAVLLEADDREVRACGSAEAALVEIGQHRCDVLITDVSLPGMTGMELVRQLLEAEPSMWIIISSGYAFEQRLDQLGPHVRSLAKPFEIEAMDALLAEVRAALGRPSES